LQLTTAAGTCCASTTGFVPLAAAAAAVPPPIIRAAPSRDANVLDLEMVENAAATGFLRVALLPAR
jgi:hypothetical protein